MVSISDNEFQAFINDALGTLSAEYVTRLKNVAILYEQAPTPEQRRKLQLRRDQTLLGLYEGVPLTDRQGMQPILPDKITIFKEPICAQVSTIDELKQQIRHTLWHEMAHYFGLGHDRIHELDGK